MSGNAVKPAASISRRNAPVRGTQSFVGVMAAVWKHRERTDRQGGDQERFADRSY